MFEDSTFETMGTIHTRSRNWMIATFAFNSSILLALIFIPLLYPSVLPQIANAIQLLAPPMRVEEVRPVPRHEHAAPSNTEMPGGVMQAPPSIPTHTYIPVGPEPPMPGPLMTLGEGGPGPGGPNSPFNGNGTAVNVRPAVVGTHQVSSGVMEGMLIHRVVPTYPAIARAIRLSGTVVLQATISRNGIIENLRVMSGPAPLQRAALDAVSQWRYRPYLLDGQPVEVETTVSVEFTLN
jgi:protein TonB